MGWVNIIIYYITYKELNQLQETHEKTTPARHNNIESGAHECNEEQTRHHIVCDGRSGVTNYR